MSELCQKDVATSYIKSIKSGNMWTESQRKVKGILATKVVAYMVFSVLLKNGFTKFHSQYRPMNSGQKCNIFYDQD